MTSFVHLRVHTEYSLVDSVIRVPELMDAVAALRMPAVGLADQSTLFALVKFYRQAEKRGIKPVVGADVWVRAGEPQDPPYRLTLFCRDQRGYRQLSELVTRSFLEGQHLGMPLIERGWLDDGLSEGLIALSGAREGDVGRLLLAGHSEAAAAAAENWARLFPDAYYLELIRTGREGEEAYLAAAVALAADKGLPVVATNDVRMLVREDFEAHEARVCIHDGRTLDDPRRVRRYSDQQYLKSADEMAELFADLPAALENSVEIARRCNLELRLGKNFLPAFPIPDGSDVETHLRREAEAGLEARLAKLPPEVDREQYRERLEREIKVIVDMGFPGYFLIVADFIRWARGHDVPVGPGRGSGAGSVVAWALTITDLDPLQYDLLFERFLNPERVSMPDFDVDFCMEGRDRVIDYVAERYGRERVAQIITYGSMAARAVVRDVGRVLGHPYGYVDRIAKLIPFELGMTLDKALAEDAELGKLYADDEEVRTLIDLARALEGLARNAGKHAGGVVIAPTPLTDFTPLYAEQGSEHAVTQLDKDDVEAVGLVKFDFLGLRTLTIIDWAVKTINERRAQAGEAPLDITALPLDDAVTYEQVFKKARTVAIFQFESAGMQRLLKDARPDRFEDIIALGALYRPGPMDLIPSFVARKHGREKVEYPDPRVEPILKETYGIMVYQEQVMQMAQIVGGYTLGGADLLRRAMGKKKPEEMVKHRAIFREGAAKNGLSAEQAERIFDLMEKFAGYGFNKSHAAAYALLSYQTAWLKAHYPAEFMAAVLSSDMDHTDKVVTLIDEVRSMKLEILPPDVNRSAYAFTVAGPRAVRYGLGAIKGVGKSAIEMLIEERARGGDFRDLAELCRRIDTQRANRRTLEALIRAGAFDGLGAHRAALMSALGQALQLAEQHKSARAAGQNDLFGLGAAAAEPEAAVETVIPADVPEWDDLARLTAEKETLGLYLTGHPITRYAAELSQVVSAPIGTLIAAEPDADAGGRYGAGQRTATVAGLVTDIRRRGGRFNLTLDDRSGRIEATLFEDAYQQYRALIVKDRVLICEGRLGFDEFINGWRITVRDLYGIDAMREKRVRVLVVDWRSNQCA
ncbi:MAG TPA: DNA polymerase III subunit alpha, partial [Gammaproteobacteria bacterium]|nr:DNA polymerase III subunit alpha [Gammaproteobacteria bacterium]